jgi:hypothetical protein
MSLLIAAVYNLILLIGTVYLVGWQNWSPWWFLLTMCCAASFSDKK